ncbi:MAG: hypothetical protein KIT84_13310 [Labilithrix sp.]|nr:hypothetical protein [Labilithrix sp.]MCW5811995.1 hypothetical protein [Labilithrix sp.]
MRSSLSLASLLLLSSVGAAVMTSSTTGCAPAADDSATSDQAATAAEDLATAKSVVELLNGKCKNCHGVTEAKIKSWGLALTAVDAAVFAPTDIDPQSRITNLRSDPNNPASPFSAKKLGLYAAGVQQEQFKTLFQEAYGAATWETEYKSFVARTNMPRGAQPFDAAEFATIKGWILKGMPQLAQAFGAPPEPEPTPACVPSITPELKAHIEEMKTQGWGARLADQATPMFGCAEGQSGSACLTTFPDTTATFGTADVPQTLRTLIDERLASHFWVRSSADGRYVGFGYNSHGAIVDLKSPAKPIHVDAPYDPYFLPSNDGFAYAGANASSAIVLCKQSLLGDAASSDSPRVSLTESKCATMHEQVYMSIGTSLDGLRYFMTFGAHSNDDGGHDITTQLPADYGADARTAFVPMINDGLSYKAQRGVVVTLPHEGDLMLSPSTQLAATRFGDLTSSQGYRIRFVKPSTDATTGALTVDAPLAATVCVPGQKANISFDERFMVTHQYVDPAQADQAGLPAGSANIVLTDLLTGKIARITTMKKDQYALYPHFRADGWLYFNVRDMAADKEYVVASDAAIQMAATP